MRFASIALLGFAACISQGHDDGGDVVGPFTGPTHHYVVDRIDLPTTNTLSRELGADLNNDHQVDNLVGQVISFLSSMGDVTTHGSDMIGAGAIASSVDIVANDLTNDETVAVIFHGADGEANVPVGGTMANGVFVSNRTTTEHPGRATVHLPVYVDADPSTLVIEKLEIDLSPDGDGGFDAYLRGGVDAKAAIHEAFLGAYQMVYANPADHRSFMKLLDVQHDWTLTEYDFITNDLIKSLFSPDVTLDGTEMMSIGIRVHLTPCDGGCTLPPPTDHCSDRVIDGDESGVDCGGPTCGACAAGGQCATADDCQSGRCSGGMCMSTTCTDGLQNGFETEVDCGGECDACAVGDACFEAADCPTGSSCGPPCTGTFCSPHIDTCR